MTVEQAIRGLAHAGNVLPQDAMRWALDNWDVAGPRFVALLGRCADGYDRSDETADVLFFAVHLLGEKRESAAFGPLCRLLADAGAGRQVLGDATTETLCGLLISTYDGDAAALKAVIESAAADEFVRTAALEAMTYLARSGAFTDAEMRAYLLHLLMEMRPRAPCFVWSGWALAVANLGYADYAGEVRRLLRRGFISSGDMNMGNFNEQLRRTLDDPDRMAGFAYDRIGPFSDAIGILSGWYCFSEECRLQEERVAARLEELAALRLAEEPHVNPLRHIGRNDPCPCGSGRKYKKCCLN